MKLILYPEAGVARLYDLRSDPFEQRDLADDPAQADRLASLFAELQRLQDELGDPLDLGPTFADRLAGAE